MVYIWISFDKSYEENSYRRKFYRFGTNMKVEKMIFLGERPLKNL